MARLRRTSRLWADVRLRAVLAYGALLAGGTALLQSLDLQHVAHRHPAAFTTVAPAVGAPALRVSAGDGARPS